VFKILSAASTKDFVGFVQQCNFVLNIALFNSRDVANANLFVGIVICPEETIKDLIDNMLGLIYAQHSIIHIFYFLLI
jgi:hypothetical protein